MTYPIDTYLGQNDQVPSNPRPSNPRPEKPVVDSRLEELPLRNGGDLINFLRAVVETQHQPVESLEQKLKRLDDEKRQVLDELAREQEVRLYPVHEIWPFTLGGVSNELPVPEGAVFRGVFWNETAQAPVIYFEADPRNERVIKTFMRFAVDDLITVSGPGVQMEFLGSVQNPIDDEPFFVYEMKWG